ncbi:MAG TPA: helix-turn-helix domain-containing protein [Polyangia bacterium]|jgi:cytoskeletal protein RodZ
MHDNLGHYLRSERENRSIALGDVSRTTKIPVRSLERLEKGEYEALPGEVFVRGFIKSYARCLGIDDEGALLIYDSEKERRREDEVAEVQAVVETQARDTGAGLARRRVGFAVFVVIILIIATITLSLLLRRPHHDIGGVSGAVPGAGPYGTLSG